jgi:hypothetical protein
MITFLSLTSLSAHATEIWIRSGSKVLKAEVPESQAELDAMNSSDLISLLQTANVVEVTAPISTSGNSGDGIMAWTENQNAGLSWTEIQDRTLPWTEKRDQ